MPLEGGGSGRMTLRFIVYLTACVALYPCLPLSAATSVPPLPARTQRPMDINPANDPILALRRNQESFETFQSIIRAAMDRHPAREEAEAALEEAEASRMEAIAGRLPSGEVSITSFKTISRDFSNDPANIIERSRPRQRTDATLTLQQPVFDFGFSRNRIAAATARLSAAAADIDNVNTQVAVRTTSAWYDIFAYRALVSLTSTFAENQRDLRKAVEFRIRQGVSAEGDLALVDSYIGSADRQLAEAKRELARAEARFVELVGMPAPQGISRAPVLSTAEMSKDRVAFEALEGYRVKAAEANARATRNDAKATHAQNRPQVAVGVDAGRYGVFETSRDYDVRARVSLRQKIFGGTESRARQADARARSAEARAQRTREEAVREAVIAWSDVQALEESLGALESSYIASRRSRDVIAERFRVSRGTLFDVLSAEENLLNAAASYIRTLTELDTARYTLLSSTGRLLPALDVGKTPTSVKK